MNSRPEISDTKPIVCFGEVMARLCPPGCDRLRQAMPGRLEVTFAGAEVNVAVSIAYLGGRAGFVTRLPDNPVSEACLAELRGFGVDLSGVRAAADGRFGVYYVERGANQRPGRVVYDREHSSMARAEPGEFDWERILEGAGWFHFSGVTPALSRGAAACCREALEACRRIGVGVSCDLNFRASLWRWEEAKPPRDLAAETMAELLPYVDLLVANEGSAADVLGIRCASDDAAAGSPDPERCRELARRIRERFPSVRRVAMTLRESVSASRNNWGGALYDAEAGRVFFAPLDEKGSYRPYAIHSIVDRVGTGDAFVAGLLFALQSPDSCDPSWAVSFAAAASCLAHSIEGDYNLSRRAEVEALLAGSASGHIER